MTLATFLWSFVPRLSCCPEQSPWPSGKSGSSPLSSALAVLWGPFWMAGLSPGFQPCTVVIFASRYTMTKSSAVLFILIFSLIFKLEELVRPPASPESLPPPQVVSVRGSL